MERVSKRNDNDRWLIDFIHESSAFDADKIEKMIKKCREYENMEEDGLIVKLPYKEIYTKCGDTVFIIYNGEIVDVLMCNPIILEDGSIQISLCSDEFIFECRTPDAEHDTDPQDWCDNHIEVTSDDFGKMVFFTREEAEKHTIGFNVINDKYK